MGSEVQQQEVNLTSSSDVDITHNMLGEELVPVQPLKARKRAEVEPKFTSYSKTAVREVLVHKRSLKISLAARQMCSTNV